MAKGAKKDPSLTSNLQKDAAPVTERDRRAKRAAPAHRPRALLVLGMHRSGTSATAGVCHLLGVEFGSRLLPPAPDNDEGFWEQEDVLHVHEELLAAIGSAWDDVRALPEDWLNHPATATYREKITGILGPKFSDSPLWCVKDPRMCRLVPFWLAVLRDLGCEPRFLLVGRNPLEVAGSLATRNSIPAPKSQLLWLRHLIDAERDTRGHPRAFITYDALLQDWRRAMSRASRELGFTWPRSISAVAPKVDRFLHARMQHQKVDDVIVETDSHLSRWIRDAYRGFKAAQDGEETQLRRTLATIVRELNAVAPLLEPWIRGLEIDLAGAQRELENRNAEMESLCKERAAAQAAIGKKDGEIERLGSDVSARDGEIERLGSDVSARGGEIERLSSDVSARGGEIERLSSDVSARDGQIEQLAAMLEAAQGKIANRDQEVQRLSSEMSARDHKIERLHGEFAVARTDLERHSARIESLSRELESVRAKSRDQGREVISLNTTVHARDRELEELGSRLAAILQSTSWKVTKPIRDLKLGTLTTLRKGRNAFHLALWLLRYGPFKGFRFMKWFALLRYSPLFDVPFYLHRNPDVLRAGINPIMHYIEYGAAEGRDPNPLFDTSYYLEQNPDVANADINPLIHYLKHGVSEKRDPNSRFDTAHYLEQNPTLVEGGGNPLIHYLQHSVRQRRIPSPLADNGSPPKISYDHEEATVDRMVEFLVRGVDMAGHAPPRLALLLGLDRLGGQDHPELDREVRQHDKWLKHRLSASHPHCAHLVFDQKRLASAEPDTLDTIDVVVCIHNALTDVKACLQRLGQTAASITQLILIDDGSEPETTEYVRRFSDVHKAKFIRNEEACGYPAAATQGLVASSSDIVILLNSDTLPTQGWAHKILACANSDKRIGIVGVLSNTASWQSVPKIFDDADVWAANPLPSDLSLNQFAALVERYSTKLYPKLPFINGFCFAIKRSLMDDIGLFDYKSFTHYGEENDFCLRAAGRGWLGAIADDTYVFHKQSRSYTDARRLALAPRADEILAEKHDPKLIQSFGWACRQSLKMQGIRSRVEAAMERFRIIRKGVRRFGGKRLSIMLPGIDGGGVAVIMQEALAMANMGVTVEILNFEIHRERFIASNNIDNSPILLKFFEDKDAIVKYIEKTGHEIDAIICTHCSTPHWLVTLDLASFDFVVVYYVQDYEPYFFPKHSEEYKLAKQSYKTVPDMGGITKTQWNKDVLHNQVEFPATVIGPSVDIDLFRPRKEKNYFKASERTLIAAMVRPSTPRRAPEATYRALKILAERFPEQVHVFAFGCSNDELRHCIRSLSERVVHLGNLDRQEVAKVLGECDIFLDLSTYQAMGLTALEAMACGCAVVVPSHGGAVDFVEDGIDGVALDTTDFDLVIERVSALIENHEYRERIQIGAVKKACTYFPEKAAFRMLSALFDSKDIR